MKATVLMPASAMWPVMAVDMWESFCGVLKTQRRLASTGSTMADEAAIEIIGVSDSAATSIMKNVGARVTQDRAELGVEIMGMNGLGWEGEGFSAAEIAQTRTWLWGKAVSIYGGSTEIQNNVIAKRILGMLDHQ